MTRPRVPMSTPSHPVCVCLDAVPPRELSERSADPIVVLLDRLVARDGPETTKLRVFAFLARYFGDEEGEGSEEPAEPAPSPQEDALRAGLRALRAQVEALNAAVARVSPPPAPRAERSEPTPPSV